MIATTKPQVAGSLGGLPPTLLTSLEQAVSAETRGITRAVEALRSGPSPGGIQSRIDAKPPEKPLEDVLFDALATVKVLTSQVAMHMDSEWRKKLFRQLDSLHDPAEWETGDVPVQQASFSTFLKAMLTIHPERRPGLGLSHTGHLIAAWVTGSDRLVIEFLPNDRVRWTLSISGDEGPIRYGADIPVTHLSEGLASHNPQHWFAHAKESREHS